MNEKMRVLDMLDNGKITAAEASQLLESLGHSGDTRFREQREHVEERLHVFAQDVSKFAKDVGDKVHAFYKGVEPRIKKAGQSALEKAAAALDDLAHTIHESLERAQQEAEAATCCDEDDCTCGEDAKEDDTPGVN